MSHRHSLAEARLVGAISRVLGEGHELTEPLFRDILLHAIPRQDLKLHSVQRIIADVRKAALHMSTPRFAEMARAAGLPTVSDGHYPRTVTFHAHHAHDQRAEGAASGGAEAASITCAPPPRQATSGLQHSKLLKELASRRGGRASAPQQPRRPRSGRERSARPGVRGSRSASRATRPSSGVRRAERALGDKRATRAEGRAREARAARILARAAKWEAAAAEECKVKPLQP